MLGILSLILIFLPLLFQLLYGTKAIFKTTSLVFNKISLISTTFQIVFSLLIFGFSYYNFSKYFDEHPDKARCLTPIAGLIFVLVFFSIALLITIAIQYIIKEAKENRSSSNK